MAKTVSKASSVFSDLGFSAAEAENLRVRSDLMRKICRNIASRQMTQEAASVAFGVSQPRISDLVRGKLHKFSIDALVTMLAHGGLQISIGSDINYEHYEAVSTESLISATIVAKPLVVPPLSIAEQLARYVSYVG